MKNKFKEYFWITIGYLITAFGIKFFIAPNKIAGGGVTGIAILINYFIPQVSVAIIMLFLNVILFIIAFIFIGGKFGGKTIYATLSLSGALYVMDRFFPQNYAITNDLLLATIFGTFLSGIGLGLVFNQNASTGGTDILAKILNKFFHLDIGKALLIVDFIVALSSVIIFNAEIGMYAILAVVLNGVIVDKVIEGLNTCKSIFIISGKQDLVIEYIIKELDRGCTIFEGKGAFSGKKGDILYTVLGRKEFIKLRNFMKSVDKNAFVIVSEAHEVLGEGFKNIIEE
ncbi:YitT family protein [Clostridium sediminicola]|uniref:YitT family protein n=1 Tax=Clostridium sediminicola TaxID=3114879 RepID=UPI0031F1FBC0